MSRTTSRGREADQRAEGLVSAEAGGTRGRGRWVALGVVVVVAAGAVAGWQAGLFSPAASPGAGQQGAPAPDPRAVACVSERAPQANSLSRSTSRPSFRCSTRFAIAAA